MIRVFYTILITFLAPKAGEPLADSSLNPRYARPQLVWSYKPLKVVFQKKLRNELETVFREGVRLTG